MSEAGDRIIKGLKELAAGKFARLSVFSSFAILDVKTGRAALKRHFDNGGEPLPVVIHGHIYGVHGNDDGVSREFSVEVDTAVITNANEAEANE